MRYFLSSTDLRPFEDHFEFELFSQGIRSERFTCTIKFLRVELIKRNRKALQVSANSYSSEREVSNENLLTSTNSNARPGEIWYMLDSFPQYGILILRKSSRNSKDSSENSEMLLTNMRARFSQDDVNEGRLIYRFTSPIYFPKNSNENSHKIPQTSTETIYTSPTSKFQESVLNFVKDKVRYKVLAPGAIGETEDMEVVVRVQKIGQRLINRGLADLDEGGERAIRPEELFVENFDEGGEISKSGLYVFRLLNYPKHGNLKLYDTQYEQIVNILIIVLKRAISIGFINYRNMYFRFGIKPFPSIF